jgi:hypothetical protein
MKNQRLSAVRLPLSGAAWLAATASVLAMLLVAPKPAAAFDQGSSNIGITLGAGRALDRDYTVIGGRVGHFVADGFELALSGELWRGNDPDIYKLTPEVRYVWYMMSPVQPYVGGFYSRTVYDGLPDRNSYGAKGGVYFSVSHNASLAVGLVHERIESCSSATYRNCSQTYPEVAFNVRF